LRSVTFDTARVFQAFILVSIQPQLFCHLFMFSA
jgi:hypothetical protein